MLAPAELAAGHPLQEVSYQLAIGNDNGLVLQPAEADELAHGCVWWREAPICVPEDAKPASHGPLTARSFHGPIQQTVPHSGLMNEGCLFAICMLFSFSIFSFLFILINPSPLRLICYITSFRRLFSFLNTISTFESKMS